METWASLTEPAVSDRPLLRWLILLSVLAGVMPAAAPPTTTRVSLDTLGLDPDDFSTGPAISSDGRFVAFASRASDLVTGDTNGFMDVFLRDRLAGTTTRVSLASTPGVQSNGNSFSPAISADGQYVAFVSAADNLVIGDLNKARDVFRHNRVTGATQRVSVLPAGVEPNAGSFSPSISSTGRYIAFASYASNLSVDTNEMCDVFRRDMDTGLIRRASVGPGAAEGNGDSEWPSISGDGRYTAFASTATNLVASDTNGSWDIFIRDIPTSGTMTTTRVSISTGSIEGNSHSVTPSISADGQVIAFASDTTNLVAGDTNATWDIFRRNWKAVSPATLRVSVPTSSGEGNGASRFPSVSSNGNRIAFYSYASNLVGTSGDTNAVQDCFLRDLAGAGTTTRVSLTTGGAEATGLALWPSISADGHFVAFPSAADNLVGSSDQNNVLDVFVRGSIP